MSILFAQLAREHSSGRAVGRRPASQRPPPTCCPMSEQANLQWATGANQIVLPKLFGQNSNIDPAQRDSGGPGRAGPGRPARVKCRPKVSLAKQTDSALAPFLYLPVRPSVRLSDCLFVCLFVRSLARPFVCSLACDGSLFMRGPAARPPGRPRTPTHAQPQLSSSNCADCASSRHCPKSCPDKIVVFKMEETKQM